MHGLGGVLRNRGLTQPMLDNALRKKQGHFVEQHQPRIQRMYVKRVLTTGCDDFGPRLSVKPDRTLRLF